MAKPKKLPPEERVRDASLVLFLALNMILLAFFILLTALSQPNETKEAELLIEVRKAFQSFGGSFLGLGEELDASGISKERHALESTEKIELMIGELTQFVEENKESKAISFEMSSEGMTIHISEEFSFRQGSTELLEQGLPLYNSIYTLILHTSNDVRIEGHTDNAEIRTPLVRDNWELSAMRALALFRFFVESGELSQSRFKLVGYGDHRPLTTNLTAEGRRKNRRVSIIFLGELRSIER